MQDDFDLCLVLNSRMAARAVTRYADRRLRPYGITAAQFNILGGLAYRPGRSITEMAQAIAMDRTTLSRNLALLERNGLARMEPVEGGARIYAVTDTGRALFERVVPEWRQSQAELREELRDPDFMTVVAGLRHLARL